jgi:hypothetical protein
MSGYCVIVFIAVLATMSPHPLWGLGTRAPSGDSLVRAVVIDTVRLRLDSSATASLESVQRIFGPARIHEATHHDDAAWECYVVPTKSGPVYMRLFAHYYLSAPPHWLGGFELSEHAPPGGSATSCSMTSHAYGTIETDNGLFVGMPVERLLSIMHTPRERQNGLYKFEYLQPDVVGPNGRYDISGGLEAETHDGHVTRLFASYAETT